MRYYKDTNGNRYAFDDSVTSEIIAKVEDTHNTTLIKMTKKEIAELSMPGIEQLRQNKIAELKQKAKEYQDQDIQVGSNIFNGGEAWGQRYKTLLEVSLMIEKSDKPKKGVVPLKGGIMWNINQDNWDEAKNTLKEVTIRATQNVLKGAIKLGYYIKVVLNAETKEQIAEVLWENKRGEN